MSVKKTGLRFRFLLLFFACYIPSIALIAMGAIFYLNTVRVQEIEAALSRQVKFSLAYIEARHEGDWRTDTEDGLFYKGTTNMSGNFALVDELAEFNGYTVTIFQGNTRVATTIRDAQGKRVVGTQVSAKVQEAVLKEGRLYLGRADILGTPFHTVYSPLKDAQGSVVGIYYMGISEADAGVGLHRLRLLIIILSLLAALVSIPLIVLVVNRLLRPLIELKEWARNISTGNMKAELHATSRGDEVGQVTQALRDMLMNLRQMIMLIRKTGDETSKQADGIVEFSKQFSQGAQDQAAAAEEASAAMEEMAASAENLEQRVADSARAMGSIEKTLGQLNSSIDAIKDSMRNLTTLASGASTKAKGGDDQVRQAITTMERIQESSEKIAEFVSFISEISDQTNLLALNASIEAARAGDAGRGFAVVAQEITKLADRTLSNAKEIKVLIQASAQAVTNGSDQVKSIALNLNGILTDVQDIENSSESVMARIYTQAENTDSISKNAGNLTSISEEILSTLKEQKRATKEIETTISNVAGSAQNVSNGTADLVKLSDALRGKSEDLMKTIVKFDG